jgi:imidazolonepropionase-like amidohydrolase
MPIAAKQMLRAGVTSAIDLGTPFQILDLRKKIRAGEIPGPRLTVSGPWISRISWPGIPPEFETIISSTEEAILETRRNIENGADVIKVWAGLSEDDYRAVVKEAHKHGIKVHAHLYHPEAIRAAIAANVDVFQHVGSARNPPYDDELLAEIAHNSIPVVQTISHRIWVYPATVEFPERLYNPIHKKDMPPDIYAEFIDSFKDFHRLSYFHDIGRETRNAKIAARQFIDAGAYMGVGTDAASPLNFHTEAMWYEMSALVDSGMTPIQVISAATKTNAEILGQFDELGTIEPGKLADMIVIDGNPLANIDNLANVELVIKDGGIWYAETAAFGPVTNVGHAF